METLLVALLLPSRLKFVSNSDDFVKRCFSQKKICPNGNEFILKIIFLRVKLILLKRSLLLVVSVVVSSQVSTNLY